MYLALKNDCKIQNVNISSRGTWTNSLKIVQTKLSAVIFDIFCITTLRIHILADQCLILKNSKEIRIKTYNVRKQTNNKKKVRKALDVLLLGMVPKTVDIQRFSLVDCTKS